MISCPVIQSTYQTITRATASQSGRARHSFSVLSVFLFLVFLPILSGATESNGANSSENILLAQAGTKNKQNSPAEQYLANCGACHQSDGQGLPGAFPPLADSDFIQNDPWVLVEATVVGLSGPLMVNGKEYNNIMPAMSYLTDDELARILTYVLNSWGNPGGSFDAEQISIYRKAIGLEARQAAGERHPGTPEAEVVYQGQPLVLDGAANYYPGCTDALKGRIRYRSTAVFRTLCRLSRCIA